jgi:hypothetical protein
MPSPKRRDAVALLRRLALGIEAALPSAFVFERAHIAGSG